jgi:hypothetical protein
MGRAAAARQARAAAVRVNERVAGTVTDFTPIDLRLSGWHGDAGVRFLAAPSSAVSPYVEATAGAARLQSTFAGAGRVDPLVNTALRFFDRTEPLLRVGGGILVRGGPLALDPGIATRRSSRPIRCRRCWPEGTASASARRGSGWHPVLMVLSPVSHRGVAQGLTAGGRGLGLAGPGSLQTPPSHRGCPSSIEYRASRWWSGEELRMPEVRRLDVGPAAAE